MHSTFLEEMGFVATRVRKLPGHSRGWRKTVFRGGPPMAGRGRQGMGQEERPRPQLGRGHRCVAASVGSLPLALEALEKLLLSLV